MWICLTILAACAGGLLLKNKVPGGMLVGSILAVSLLNIATGHAVVWTEIRILAQGLTGAFVGCKLGRKEIRLLPKVVGPYLTVMGSFLILNLLVSACIYRTTSLDLLTSLLCAMPGGMSDVPLIAMDMGAEVSVVAAMQFVRLIFGMACLPIIIQFSDRIIEPETAREMESHSHALAVNKTSSPPILPFLPVLAVALVAALLGYRSGIIAGGLSFATITIAALKIADKVPPIPFGVREVAQVISGCYIGCTIGMEQLLQLRQVIIPSVILCAAFIIWSIGVGYSIHRIFGVPLREAMLSLAPAGASEMALIAADLGVESANLVVLQICRLVGVMLIFPHIYNFILYFI